MPSLPERAYHELSLAVGTLLRSARYAEARIVRQGAVSEVRKRRASYAPLLVFASGPLFRILDAGTRVLSQEEWEERERQIYATQHGTAIAIDPDGTLVLPLLPGESLATLLDNERLDESEKARAIELAVRCLADFHARGLTHGDAMAENVLIDLEAGVARWIDFETVHDANRPVPWRRADDLRALLATCLLRTEPERVRSTLDLILTAYADEDVTRVLAASFNSPFPRQLPFCLGQAALPFERYRQIASLLSERAAWQVG